MRRLPSLLGAAALALGVVVSGRATNGDVSGLFGGDASAASSQSLPNCGLSQAALCETFNAAAGIGNRSGQLNGTLWGVSHVSGEDNVGNPSNGWGLSKQTLCGSSQTVGPENDIFVCNGMLVEGQDDNQGVTSISMYPKQPFDFAGRTGKVTFDVSNDAQGTHAAWPEFWLTDQPVPGPFAHLASLHSLPRNGFGLRLSGFANATGQGASCPEGSPAYVGVASALTVTNYVENDTDNGGNLQLHGIDCVKASTGIGQMNHYEIDVSQSQIDVYGTDAGTTAPLKHLATISNANLNFTRGLIWLGDAHYNANKFNTQGTHAFSWANVGFDGPVLPRDLAYDVNDSLTPSGKTDPNTGMPVVNTGWSLPVNGTHTWTIDSVANPTAGSGVLLTFGFWSQATPPYSLNYAINGHAHTLAWPYPDHETYTPKTIAVPLNLAEVQSGTNTISITSPVQLNVFNIDLILVGAGGIVNPPQSNAATPSSAPPTQTPVPPTPSSAGSWTNVTSNLANLPSECGNLTMLSSVPDSQTIIAGVAAKGLFASSDGGASWAKLGTGAGSAVITNRPSWISYDPLNPAAFWESGIYSNGAFATNDGGKTFSQLGSVTHDDFVSVDFTDPKRQTLLVGGHEQTRSVWKSTNGGQSWTNIGLNLPSGTGFSTSPVIVNSQTYLVNSDPSYINATPGIFGTTDGGATWIKVSEFGPWGPPLVAANGSIYWSLGGGLVRSTDHGATWTKVGSGLVNQIHPIELPDGRLVSVAPTTLVVSADGGATWKPIGARLPYTPAGVVYSATQKAFYIWHWDCGSTVLPDAIEKLSYDAGSSSVPPTNTPVPPTNTPVPPTPAPISTPTSSTNLARSATASASSENVSTGQTAAKAIDGVIGGYPSNPSAEWATVHGGAGSWLKLSWASPQTVSRVVLYDRPNQSDQVTGGNIQFSDGSSVPVGALNNDGSPVTIDFPARTITSLKFNVTSVSPTTRNVGLAEIQVFNTSGSAPANAPTPASTPTSVPTAVPTSAPVPPAPSTSGAGCQFHSAPGASAAFCETLAAGPQAGGRNGDLSNAKWSVSRFVGVADNNSPFHFPSTPASACKAGVTSMTADSDILACDSASGHAGQMLTGMSAQTYGLLSMRPRQAFDFTGRTGTISYNVDAVTEGGLSWWTSLFVTDQPNAGANNTEKVTGEIPRNGVGVNFNDNCNTQATQMRVNSVYVFNNYAETKVPLNNTTCVQTQRGSLNHIEVRLSQTSIEVWASDFSRDGGKTYPNFRSIGQAAISVPFTTGYVHFQQEERAPEKYATQFNLSQTYTNNYWSDLGFDGPLVGVEAGYEVNDALTSNPNGGVNLGYGLLSSPNSTYTCCPQTPAKPFMLNNVALAGVNSAKLTFSVYYTLANGTLPSTIGVQYRLNGGAWHTPNPAPDYSKAFYCATCPMPAGNANWSVAYAFPVAVTELRQGTNTLEIVSTGTSNSYPPVLANIDLLTFGGATAI